jgi:hypothetical protein
MGKWKIWLLIALGILGSFVAGGTTWPECLERNNHASWVSRTWFAYTRTRDEQCLRV